MDKILGNGVRSSTLLLMIVKSWVHVTTDTLPVFKLKGQRSRLHGKIQRDFSGLATLFLIFIPQSSDSTADKTWNYNGTSATSDLDRIVIFIFTNKSFNCMCWETTCFNQTPDCLTCHAARRSRKAYILLLCFFTKPLICKTAEQPSPVKSYKIHSDRSQKVRNLTQIWTLRRSSSEISKIY